MTKLLGIGAALVDCLAHVPEDFLNLIDGDKGGMELIDFPVMQEIIERLPAPPSRAPGGSAANTIMGYAITSGNSASINGKYYRQFLKTYIMVKIIQGPL